VPVKACGAAADVGTHDLIFAGVEVVDVRSRRDANAPVDGTKGRGVSVKQIEGHAESLGEEDLPSTPEEAVLTRLRRRLAGRHRQSAAFGGGDAVAGEGE